MKALLLIFCLILLALLFAQATIAQTLPLPSPQPTCDPATDPTCHEPCKKLDCSCPWQPDCTPPPTPVHNHVNTPTPATSAVIRFEGRFTGLRGLLPAEN